MPDSSLETHAQVYRDIQIEIIPHTTCSLHHRTEYYKNEGYCTMLDTNCANRALPSTPFAIVYS